MSGISNIIDIIDSKTEEKIENILREAELQKEKSLKEVKEKAQGISQSILEKAESESKAELSRQEASAKLKAKYKFLEAKEKVMTDILDTAKEDMLKQVKSKKYGDILTRLAVAGGVALNEDSLEIVLPKGQAKAITASSIAKKISDEVGKKVSVKVSKDNIRSSGGLIIRTTDGTKWVDNTFEARLERFESKIRDQVSAMLFIEETG